MRILDHVLGRIDLELRKCGAIKRESFGLNELDYKLNEYIHFRNGIFVEAGGNNGINQSNSLFFEKYLGWKGLLVEPIPYLAELCRRYRPNAKIEQCALVPSNFQAKEITIFYCNLMSVVDGFRTKESLERHLDIGRQFLVEGDETKEMSVPVQTLTAVMDKSGFNQIDLLSLDVEGFELQVLQGLDLRRYAPAWMVVECMDPGPILNQVGRDLYEHVASLTPGDQLFRRKT